MTRTRLSCEPFPSYTHRPGITVHPNQPGGHSYGLSEPLASPLLAGEYPHHALYLFGLDLFNHGYFWESHVAFEAIWNAHHRVGDEANILKALIKLAAAGVKAHQNSNQASLGHIKRGLELIEAVDADILKNVFGLDQQQLLKHLQSLLSGSPFLNQDGVFEFELIPASK